MISNKVAAQATALSAAILGSLGFLLHDPCRNTSYGKDVFNTLCYSDLAPAFAADNSEVWNEFAPLPALFGRLIASVEIPWLYQLVIWQLLVFGLLVAAVVAIFNSKHYKFFTGSYLLLSPALAFTIFVADSGFAVSFLIFSLIFWHQGKFKLAGFFAGLALASGAWSWVLLLAYFVIARRYEALEIFRKVLLIALGVSGLISLSRFLFAAPLLIPVDFSAGEGTPLFVTNLVQSNDFGSNLIPWLIGLAVTLGLVWYLDLLPLDFRIEPVIALFISVQLLTSIAISPQHLLHLIWIIPLWLSNYRFILGTNLVLVVYTFAVWFRLENGEEYGRGLPDIPYALIAFGFWGFLIWLSFRAFKSITQVGIDRQDKIATA